MPISKAFLRISKAFLRISKAFLRISKAFLRISKAFLRIKKLTYGELLYAGIELSSHPVARKLLSALTSFTILFGMGRSGSTSHKSPRQICFFNVLYGISSSSLHSIWEGVVQYRLPFEALLCRAKEGSRDQHGNFTILKWKFQQSSLELLEGSKILWVL